jgi:hypothetical protein
MIHIYKNLRREIQLFKEREEVINFYTYSCRNKTKTIYIVQLSPSQQSNVFNWVTVRCHKIQLYPKLKKKKKKQSIIYNFKN